MGYIIHELFHFLVGSSLAYVLFIKNDDPIGNRAQIIFFGGIAAISPDITKFFGDNFGHSIWLVPVFGLVIAFGFHIFRKDFPFIKAWGLFSFIVLFGHLIIDYLGNGVAFLYPLSQEEFTLSIIRRNDYFSLFILLIVVLIGLFYRKGKKIILPGLIIISLYLGGLIVSKLQLEQALNKQYKGEEINLLSTYRSIHFFEWNFMVRTNKVWVNGTSPILNREIRIEEERKLDE